MTVPLPANGDTSWRDDWGAYVQTAADSVNVGDLSGSTATGRNVLKAASQSAARSAIGAGTSNLALGTTSSTAKAGDYTPSAASLTASGVVELATTAETTTGTDATRATTPAGVKAVADTKLGIVSGSGLTDAHKVTQAAYDALSAPRPAGRVYFIVG